MWFKLRDRKIFFLLLVLMFCCFHVFFDVMIDVYRSYLFNSSFWYEKTYYEEKDDNIIPNDDNNNNNNNGLLFCSCGSEMECTLPGVVYDFGMFLFVFCVCCIMCVC